MAVALDRDERKRYWEFRLAGGKKKDWSWSSSDQAGTRSQRSFWDKVIAKMGGGMRGDVAYIAQEDWERIARITETMPDGSKRVRYENEKGEDITDRVRRLQDSGQEIFKRSKVRLEK